MTTGCPAWVQESDAALLADFGGPATLAVHRNVMALYHALARGRIEGVKNLHSADCTLLVVYDPLRWAPQDLISKLEEAAGSAGTAVRAPWQGRRLQRIHRPHPGRDARIHGDNRGAVATARAVRRRFEHSAVQVCPWHSGAGLG